MAEVTTKMNRASLRVLYNGVNISQDISPHAIGFTYTDHEGGKADDLQIRLEDSRSLWKGSWFPSKGAILTVSIRSEFHGQKRQLDCGVFAVDEITAGGRPDTVTLKAVSSFTAKSMKREKKSRAWENITLQTLAGRIAGEHNLSFYWNVESVVTYGRVDQREESDLAFLNRLCKDLDLNLKISGEKLIIFESRTMEQSAPVFSIVRGESALGGYSFTSKTHDIYRGCEVTYFDPETKEEKSHTFTPPDAPDVGQILKVNQRMESLADAMKKAEAMLRRKNREEVTAIFGLMGDTGMQAGLTGMVAGWGLFDGKYIATESSHSFDRAQGYRVSLKARKVLAW
jgi:phage protein D